MGMVIEFNPERRRLREAVKDLRGVVARTDNPVIKAALQAHLDHYTARLETLEESKLKSKRAARGPHLS
jgi:uncharacterized coiled-coil protein SlyX